MRNRRNAAIVAAVGAVAIAAAAVSAQQKPIKGLMGDNFAGLQTILVALITSNYANVPKQAEIIRDHAVELTGMMPESAKEDRDQFLTYVYSLKSHAQDLKSISEVLIEHDASRPDQGSLAVDQLREALAAHYGGLVTTCVACHNRYRPQIVTP